MYLSKRILLFLKLLHENKVLIETNKNILKAFPESVIVQSYDSERDKSIIKFANDDALQNLLKVTNPIGKLASKCYNKFKVKKYANFGSSTNMISHESIEVYDSLYEILAFHESSLSLFDEATSNIELIRDTNSFENGNNPDDTQKFYVLKSLKVQWENNHESFLHVFIDTGLIKKLEKERATNK